MSHNSPMIEVIVVYTTLVYPMTPNLDDIFETMQYENLNYLFSDIHVRGEPPYFIKRYFEENGISIDFAKGDKKLLKEHTVDFLSFSYYMSVTEAKDQTLYTKGAGNIIGGLKNPYLESSDWGWQIDPMDLELF